MMMEQNKNLRAQKESIHNVIMESRKKASISGVLDVESFDDESINLSTQMGTLIIKGISLHINKLNIDSGEVSVEGTIDSCVYSNTEKASAHGGSIFGKLFR